MQSSIVGLLREWSRQRDHDPFYAPWLTLSYQWLDRVFGHNFVSNQHAVLHRMNFVPCYVDLPQRLTVYENLRSFQKLYGVKDCASRLSELAVIFRLTELMDQPVNFHPVRKLEFHWLKLSLTSLNFYFLMNQRQVFRRMFRNGFVKIS